MREREIKKRKSKERRNNNQPFYLGKEFLVNVFFDFAKGLFNRDIPEE